MKELTLRAVLLGLVMTVVLGAANAYLGLHAGMTIAATYPAAVIGMAVLRGKLRGREAATVRRSQVGATRHAGWGYLHCSGGRGNDAGGQFWFSAPHCL